MITKQEYESQIEHYERVMIFQPNEKERLKVLHEIEILKQRILFLTSKKGEK